MSSPYLEPIEEGDLDTKKQFTGAAEIGKKESSIQNLQEKAVAPINVEKEISREMSKVEKDSSYNKILSKVKTRAKIQPSDEDVKIDAKKALEKIDPESQITKLIDLAMAKGVVHAVKVAKHMEDNYVLDMFHDKLMADELHDALIKKGLIKES